MLPIDHLISVIDLLEHVHRQFVFPIEFVDHCLIVDLRAEGRVFLGEEVLQVYLVLIKDHLRYLVLAEGHCLREAGD